jgi:anthranilate/para-aminobenzoate synthase component II
VARRLIYTFAGSSHGRLTFVHRAGLVSQDEFPRIRMIGICFGLQVLARAFGPSKIEVGLAFNGSKDLLLTCCHRVA